MVEESYLPLTLTVPELTDAQFQEFCEQYADYRLEYTAEGELIIMPPTDPETGIRNSSITCQLTNWAWAVRRGYVTDSSSGFSLPNGARRSPLTRCRVDLSRAVAQPSDVSRIRRGSPLSFRPPKADKGQNV